MRQRKYSDDPETDQATDQLDPGAPIQIHKLWTGAWVWPDLFWWLR